MKDERFVDRFDRVFAEVFKGIEALAGAEGAAARELPAEWLRRLAEKHLSDEDKALVKSLGSFDDLMDALKERLEAQENRHQGGSKWIGTAGTSPFGAYGYNPEGVRIGQHESRHRRAAKVWDRREFRTYDDGADLGTRNIKVALKRLRRWVREGAADEFDLSGTIRATASHGYLDVVTRPERRNAVKVLLFLDSGGSMDDHVPRSGSAVLRRALGVQASRGLLFPQLPLRAAVDGHAPAPRHAALHARRDPHLWTRLQGDLRRRRLDEPLRDRRSRRLGRALDEEAGAVWLGRMAAKWPKTAWLNPIRRERWDWTQSIALVRRAFDDRMFEMTLKGIEDATLSLAR